MAYKDAMNLAEDATETNGNALENQEKYAESYVGKFQSIQTQVHTFFLNFLNSDITKGILSAVDGVLEAFNGLSKATNPGVAFTAALIGIIPVANKVVKAIKAIGKVLVAEDVGKAMLNLGKNIKNGFKDSAEAIKDPSKVSTLLTAFKVGILDAEEAAQGSLTTMQKLKAGFTGLIGSISPTKLAFAGVAAAVTIGIVAYQKYKQAIEEAKSASRESATNFGNTSTDIQSNISRITELREALDSGSLTEEEAYNTKSELLSIQQQLNASYGDQVAGINLVNGSLKEQANLLNGVTKQQAKELASQDNSQLKKAIESNKSYAIDFGNASIKDKEIYAKLKEIAKKYGTTEGDISKFGNFLIKGDDQIEIRDNLQGFYDDVVKLKDEIGDNSSIDKVLESTSKQISSNKKILDENLEAYKQIKTAEMMSDTKKYDADYDKANSKKSAYDIYSDYAKSIDKYNEAIASGDTSKIAEARTEFEAIKTAMDGVNADGKYSVVIDDLSNTLDQAAINAQKLQEALTGNGGDDASKKLKSYANEMKKSGLSDIDFKIALNTDGMQEGEEGMRAIMQAAKDLGVVAETDTADAINTVSDTLVQMGILSTSAGTSMDALATRFGSVKTKAVEAAQGITDVNSILSGQSTTGSISVDDYENLIEKNAEYADALEYTNGIYKLNEEAVRRITKAKSDESIANIANEKSLEQQKYLENYEQIKKLQAGLYALDDQSKEFIARQSEIDRLQSENSSIVDYCNQFDLVTAAIEEATGAYQNWVNAQNMAESGDMFDQTKSMAQVIKDVANPDSDTFMKVGKGNVKYQAAVEFMIPDTIDSSDAQAVQNYVNDLGKYFEQSEDGAFKGLNVGQFLSDSVAKGLMTENNGDYRLAGEMTMKKFAEGMNLSLPMAQAIFGELEEYPFEFNFADEALKTIGDVKVKGVEAANALKEAFSSSGQEYKIDIDTDNIDTLKNTISQMESYRDTLDLNVNSEEYSQATQVIELCQTKIWELQNQPPVIIGVDDNQLNQMDEDIANAISKLQEFEQAKRDMSAMSAAGLDTSDAKAKVDDLLGDIQALKNENPNIDLVANLDTSSVDSLSASIEAIGQQQIDVLINGNTADVTSKAGAAKSLIESTNPTMSIKGDNSDAKAKADAAATYITGLNPSISVGADTSGVSSAIDAALAGTHTITVSVNTVGLPSVLASGSDGIHGINGTAHMSGTAHAGGYWGAPGGRTLVGEVAPEIMVNPYTGTWQTIGDNGAEFVDVPKGAIIFNHLQTKSLLENGYVTGRGKSMLTGSAMVSGGGGWHPFVSSYSSPSSSSSSSNSTSNSNSNTASNTSAVNNNTSATEENTEATEKSSQKFDWIERRLQYFSKITERISNKITDYIDVTKKNGLINQQISAIKDEISANNSAYNAYMSAANATGLSQDYKNKIMSGTFSIEEIDTTGDANKDLIEQINNFQDYYDKAMDCSDAIQELNNQLAELAKNKFENLSTAYDNEINLIKHETTMIETQLDSLEQRGMFASKTYYTELSRIGQNTVDSLANKYATLTEEFNGLMKTGTISEYSDAWYDMKDAINSVEEAYEDAKLELIKYKNEMYEMDWSVFDKMHDYISEITTEADFLIELMNGSDLFDDNGAMTDKGLATGGLHAVNYNTYMAQADEYGKKVKEIEKELANDPYNTKLVDKKYEYLKAQQDAIKNAKSEKEAVKDLISDGYDKLLKALKDVIDQRKKALDSEKDLYTYQKSVAEKTKTIAEYRKQLLALSGDDSEESMAKKQTLQENLGKAEEDLQQTEYEKWLSDQEKLMDDLYDNYEEYLNARLDNIDGLMQDMIAATNENSGTINQTIQDVTNGENGVGYQITKGMQDIWSSDVGIGKVVSDYSQTFSTEMTSVKSYVNSCAQYLQQILNQAQKEYDEKHPKPVAVKPASTPAPSAPSPASTPSSGGDGVPRVGDKVTFKSGVYYYSSDGRAPSGNQLLGQNVYITSINNASWASKPYHISRTSKFGEHDLGWVSLSQLSGYASGTMNATQGLHLTDEEGLGSELIITKKGVVRQMNAGDVVFNKQQVQRLWDLANESINTNASGVIGVDSIVSNSEANNEFNVDINIDHVQDYNDFVKQLQADPKFEKIVKQITVSSATGGNSLAKLRFR